MSKVYYAHLRKIEVNPRGVVTSRHPIATFAIVAREDTGKIHIGGSLCAVGETFCYKVGRDKALGRAMSDKRNHSFWVDTVEDLEIYTDIYGLLSCCMLINPYIDLMRSNEALGYNRVSPFDLDSFYKSWHGACKDLKEELAVSK